MTLNKLQYQIIIVLSSFILIGLPFSAKTSTSCLYLFMMFSIYLLFLKKKVTAKHWFILLGILFFGAYAIHLLISQHPNDQTYEVIKKLTFLFVPFLVINLPIIDYKKFITKTFLYFSFGINTIGIALLTHATLTYLETKNIDVYFYHQLTDLFNGNAIYFSLLFSFSLVIIFINYQLKQTKSLLFVGVFNTIIILLLSSKIFIFILILLVLFYILNVTKLKKRITLLFLIVIGTIGLINSNNFTTRFNELDLTNFLELKSDITPSTTFDGFTLRKELSNFGYQISTTSCQTFIVGVGPGSSQNMLNAKLIQNQFYQGDGTTKDSGFLGYNFHNQYIQTFVETGLIGLLLLIFMLTFLIYEGVKTKNYYLIFFNLIFSIAFLTESFLSRQIGVFTFLFFNSISLISTKKKELNIQFILKRIFDVLFSVFVIVFFISWLFPILFIIIFIETKSNPIFTQKRVGKDERYFNCYKLRTMVKNKNSNYVSATFGDQRVTKFGHSLRKYGIDELPQFFNVLLGKMSVVGPRPLMIFEENKFNKIIPNFSSRLNVKPGITGLAQAHGYKGFIESTHDLRIRYKLDKAYAKRVTLYKDIKIVLETIKFILK